jgi:hypothetical protein
MSLIRPLVDTGVPLVALFGFCSIISCSFCSCLMSNGDDRDMGVVQADDDDVVDEADEDEAAVVVDDDDDDDAMLFICVSRFR